MTKAKEMPVYCSVLLSRKDGAVVCVDSTYTSAESMKDGSVTKHIPIERSVSKPIVPHPDLENAMKAFDEFVDEGLGTKKMATVDGVLINRNETDDLLSIQLTGRLDFNDGEMKFKTPPIVLSESEQELLTKLCDEVDAYMFQNKYAQLQLELEKVA